MKHIKNKDLLIAHCAKWIFITFGYTTFVGSIRIFLVIPMFELLFFGISFTISLILKAILEEVLTTEKHSIVIMTVIVFFTTQIAYLSIGRSIPLIDNNEFIDGENIFFSFGCLSSAISIMLLSHFRKRRITNSDND